MVISLIVRTPSTKERTFHSLGFKFIFSTPTAGTSTIFTIISKEGINFWIFFSSSIRRAASRTTCWIGKSTVCSRVSSLGLNTNRPFFQLKMESIAGSPLRKFVFAWITIPFLKYMTPTLSSTWILSPPSFCPN